MQTTDILKLVLHTAFKFIEINILCIQFAFIYWLDGTGLNLHSIYMKYAELHEYFMSNLRSVYFMCHVG
jgi:hypothetical protein